MNHRLKTALLVVMTAPVLTAPVLTDPATLAAADTPALRGRREPVSAKPADEPRTESGTPESGTPESGTPESGSADVAAANSAADSLAEPLQSLAAGFGGGHLRLMLLLGLLSLAPAALLMTTSYVRIVVVLGLLRQALGNQQAPPAQVVAALALFMSALVMTPVWHDVYQDAVKPYQQADGAMPVADAWAAGVKPVRRFMSRQIQFADNSEDVWLFFRYLPREQQSSPPQSYEEVPLQVLLPAFLLSELKTAFLIGFQIYLPFLVLDFVIATVTTSMGLAMLPPATVSFPFKLMLFVLVDGWRLVAGTLLESFANY